jgi:exodeoxyribonuclease VII small subunit
MNNEENLSFEQSFTRLEEILEMMNSGKASLEDSLKLFEEADGLILKCGKYLNAAEEKIEVLLKTREGDLLLDDKQRPMADNFSAVSENIFSDKE